MMYFFCGGHLNPFPSVITTPIPAVALSFKTTLREFRRSISPLCISCPFLASFFFFLSVSLPSRSLSNATWCLLSLKAVFSWVACKIRTFVSTVRSQRIIKKPLHIRLWKTIHTKLPQFYNSLSTVSEFQTLYKLSPTSISCLTILWLFMNCLGILEHFISWFRILELFINPRSRIVHRNSSSRPFRLPQNSTTQLPLNSRTLYQLA